MNAFENVVSEILWRDGYWVQNSVKVRLTKADKEMINRPSSPRWELDVVGYSGKQNRVLVVECKSYLDSRGVTYRAVCDNDKKRASRYKLFIDETLRQVVFNRLSCQMIEGGLVPGKHQIQLVLACGHIASENDRQSLHQYFQERNWLLWDKTWLRERLTNLSGAGYENSSVAVVSKLLLRE